MPKVKIPLSEGETFVVGPISFFEYLSEVCMSLSTQYIEGTKEWDGWVGTAEFIMDQATANLVEVEETEDGWS